ncbi:MAG: TetR/AcrR family transcriptional regulator [Desulfosarcinaceae bacterium]
MARKADPTKKSTILAAAAQVFAERGYTATRIIDVAGAAQVGKGTIYEYFPSKEALFFAVFEEMMMSAERTIVKAAQTLTGRFAACMLTLSDQIISTWLAQLHMYGLVMEFWSATASSPARDRFKAVFSEGYKGLRGMVGDLIRGAQVRGEVSADCAVEEVAAALIGTWDALLLQAWLDPDFDALSASRAFMRVVLRGLAPQQNEGGKDR